MFNSSPSQPATPPQTGETSRIKSFMGRTPAIGILKSKFLTVLGNSNELLNGISSKLTLNISSSDSDYCDDDEEEIPKFDESIDYTKIDYEGRRVKARRAHEEIICGRYRQPNLAPTPRLDASRNKKREKSRSSSSSSSLSSSSTSSSSRSLQNKHQDRSHVSSATRSESIESRHSGGYVRARAIPGARRSEMDLQRDVLRMRESSVKTSAFVATASGQAPHIEVQPPSYELDIIKSSVVNMNATTSNHSIRVPPVRRKNSNSSTLTSFHDEVEYQVSPSVESTDWRSFIRSESQNSVPSWASSISLDCRVGEEPIKEFMKRFTETLFENANAIDLELKSEFGAMTRLEIGRQWFVRFLVDQKNKLKVVNELAFNSLIQHFSLVLFECNECEHFSPAAIIMNLCFAFYREIEVPGCDAYCEYLFTFMREQPIWLSLRFWNAAVFESIQTEKDHRLLAKQKKQERRRKAKQKGKAVDEFEREAQNNENENDIKALSKTEFSASSSSHQNHSNNIKRLCAPRPANEASADEDKEVENISFRQLTSFTCNMHALGAPQDMCLEFFKKQQAILGLPKEKSKLIRDNIYRIYYETEMWGSKQT